MVTLSIPAEVYPFLGLLFFAGCVVGWCAWLLPWPGHDRDE